MLWFLQKGGIIVLISMFFVLCPLWTGEKEMLKFYASILVMIFMPLTMYVIAWALENRTLLSKVVATVCGAIYSVSLFYMLG